MLEAGYYALTVEDDNGCTMSWSTIFVDPIDPQIEVIGNITNVDCNGNSTGSVTVDVTVIDANNVPYTIYGPNYPADPFDFVEGTSYTATGLAAGSYWLWTDDLRGCSDSVEVTITEPTALIVTMAGVDVTGCYGDDNGEATATVMGGTMPYSYEWSNGGATSTMTGLVAGYYEVTATDAHGCEIVGGVTLDEPPLLDVPSANVTVTNNIICAGAGNGMIELMPTGGTPAYSYNWTGPLGFSSTSQNIMNLVSGIYEITVTDANGCVFTDAYFVADGVDPIVITTNINDVDCNGNSTGSIDIAVSGGDNSPNSVYMAYLNTGASFGPFNETVPPSWQYGAFSGLPAGTYSIEVVDQNGCVTYAPGLVIAEPATLTITNVDFQNVSCNDGNDGFIEVTVDGGTTPYSYNWSDGTTNFISSDSLADNLPAGLYSVTVTDANGCEVYYSMGISEPTVLELTGAVVTNVDCYGNATGSVEITVGGATPPYSYNWSNGAITQNIYNLTAGIYTGVVTDDLGCSISATVTVTQPDMLTAAAVTVVDVDCNGNATGSIELDMMGGTMPYSYMWSNGATTQNIYNLVAGDYVGNVTDANGCMFSAMVTVNENPVLESSATSTDVIGCNGGFNGTASASATGGDGSYSYSWSNGGNTATIINLFAGSYTVTVTDGNGCTSTSTVLVTEPTAITATGVSTNVSCNGFNDGTISITASGATPPYNYFWADNVNINTPIRTGLAPGTYTVRVEDYYGCNEILSFVITEPDVLVASATGDMLTCYGDMDGVVMTTVTGGTMPYNYNWSNGDMTSDLSGLTAGSYDVTVTDANGCVAYTGAVVSQPAAYLTTITAYTTVTCNGGTDGTATLSVTGGTPGYTYLWTSGETTQNAMMLGGGMNYVTVTDANGCVLVGMVNIAEPAPVIATISVDANNDCYGDMDGEMSVTTTGGTGVYTYMWSTGDATTSISGLANGTYTVTVYDSNGCMDEASADITSPDPVMVSGTVTDVDCFGNSTGEIDITVTGGTAPYTYSWNDGSMDADRTGLTPGTYIVNIVDANGCTGSGTFVVTQPGGALDVALVNLEDVYGCYGDATGSIEVVGVNGTAPYTYQWTHGAQGALATGLWAGGYQVTVTDANGCTTVDGWLVYQPDLLVASMTQVIDVTCNGGSNGSIDMTPLGGRRNYTNQRSNGSNNQDLSGLSAGTYIVTLTDENGCTAIDSAIIAEPAAMTITVDNVIDVDCYGESTGAIFTSIMGGTAPYTISWSTPNNDVTEDVTALPAGTYVMNVTDACGDQVNATVTVDGPAAPLAAMITGTNVSCFGQATGVADLSVMGGTAPYTYLWSNGSVTEDLTGLIAGTYSVVVTDANGCTVNASVIIAQPSAALALNMTVTSVNCNGGTDGSVDLSVTGGTAPYAYNWSNGGNSQDLNGVAAGVYMVTVTDANGCESMGTATVNQPALALTLQTPAVTNVSCNGGTNGMVNITVSGGTAPYTYAWNNGAITEDLSNVAAGTYSVVVTDANGCTATTSATVTEPSVLTASAVATNVSCFGGNNGSVTLTVSGGTAPYTYNWGGGVVTQNLSNVPAGAYNVVVTDANGCIVSAGATVTQPASAVAATGTISHVLCNGGSTGAITLNVTGGTAPYTYLWSNGSTLKNQNGLAAAIYSVVVTDANGCTASQSFLVNQPNNPLVVAGSTVSNVTCFNGNNGSVDITVSGGTPPYSFAWSNGGVSEDLNNVAAGSYTVVITDNNGCTYTGGPFVVTQPSSGISAQVTGTSNVSCNGGNDGSVNIFVSGGTAPYTYQWSNGAITQNLSSVGVGTYTVNITDANGCTAVLSTSISQPAALSATINVTNVSCFGSATGVADLSVVGGTAPYTYNWNNGANTEDLNGVVAGSYNVVITDANGCVTTASATIGQPTAISTTMFKTNVSCNGSTDGTATITVSGGTPPYAYTWVTGDNTASVTGLGAGWYGVVVTDANGCSVADSVQIMEPAALSLTIQGSPAQATAVVTGGTAPYTYLWTGSQGNVPQTSQTAIGLVSVVYTVQVTDFNGCTVSGTIDMADFNIGIEEPVYNFGAGITMYPNPTSDVTYVEYEFNTSVDLTVQVYNALGEAIITANEYDSAYGKVRLDVADLADGVYFVVITDGTNVENKRLVIQH